MRNKPKSKIVMYFLCSAIFPLMIEINKVTRLTNIEYGLYYMQQVEKLNVHFGGHTSLRLCFGFPFAVMRPFSI